MTTPIIIHHHGEYLATYPSVEQASLATGVSANKLNRIAKTGKIVDGYQAEFYCQNRTGLELENIMLDLCLECPRTVAELRQAIDCELSLFVQGFNDLIANGILMLSQDGEAFEYREAN